MAASKKGFNHDCCFNHYSIAPVFHLYSVGESRLQIVKHPCWLGPGLESYHTVTHLLDTSRTSPRYHIHFSQAPHISLATPFTNARDPLQSPGHTTCLSLLDPKQRNWFHKSLSCLLWQ
jgi:hypothetical protein